MNTNAGSDPPLTPPANGGQNAATAGTLAIGDIHGCGDALDRLLELAAPTPADAIVVLGDAVDRGPQTPQVTEQLIRLHSVGSLAFVMGNHEELLLAARFSPDAYERWLAFGGRAVLDSYGSLHAIPPEHWRFWESALDYRETDAAIFVHANLEPGIPLPRQTAEWLRWRPLTGDEPPHPSGRPVIAGHTRQRSGCPWVFPGWVCIDTAACAGGWLTGLWLPTFRFVQTKQDSRDFRCGRIENATVTFERGAMSEASVAAFLRDAR